jgi:DNA-binding HxlR family transcriptional regulator
MIHPTNTFQGSIPAIRVLSGRWTLEVMSQLAKGGRRYRAVYDGIEGVSYKVLTETLRRAERDGLVTRRIDPDQVETATLYELTELGRSLLEPCTTLASWAGANWEAVEAARDRWDQLRRNPS